MSGDGPQVTPAAGLDASERRAVAALLASAFEHDPMQAWLFPNPRRRHGRLERS